MLRIGPRPAWALPVLGIALGQILSWGGLYYAFAALTESLRAELGWSVATINGAISASLLTAGLASPGVGRLIRSGHGRWCMAGGSAAAGLLLLAWSRVETPLAHYLLWAGLGVCLAAVLYEPAFAMTVRLAGAHYRRALGWVVIFGGFASTVFLPLIQWSIGVAGWRQTIVGLAAIQLLLAAPLYAWALRNESAGATTAGGARVPDHRGMGNRPARGLELWFTAHSLGFSGLVFQLVPMLAAWRLEPGLAVAAFALFGPMQVVGRVLLLAGVLPTATRGSGLLAMTALAASVGFLLIAPRWEPGVLLFAICFGLGNGMMTLLRGTSLAELCGEAEYATINGRIARSTSVAKAIAPFGLSLVWVAGGGPAAALGCLLLLTLMGIVGLLLATRPSRSSKSNPGSLAGGVACSPRWSHSGPSRSGSRLR